VLFLVVNHLKKASVKFALSDFYGARSLDPLDFTGLESLPRRTERNCGTPSAQLETAANSPVSECETGAAFTNETRSPNLTNCRESAGKSERTCAAPSQPTGSIAQPERQRPV
jgi:hypothetical protein